MPIVLTYPMAGSSTTPRAAIAGERHVRRLERAGFLVMKRPPAVGGATLGWV
jgi:hypothetical protein